MQKENKTEQDYDKIRAILQDHIKKRNHERLELDIRNVAKKLGNYFENLVGVAHSLNDSPQLYKIPNHVRQNCLRLNWAISDIEHFEALMIKIIKEGKFQE